MGLEMSEISILGRGVDDNKQAVAEPGRHQIVEDAARLVQQQRVTHPLRAETANVAGHQCLECGPRVGSGEKCLAHMGDIEQPGLGAGVQMLGKDAGRILHRHLVAGERHHARAERLMELVKRRPTQRHSILGGHPGTSDRERTRLASPMPPLSWTLRNSPDPSADLPRERGGR